MHLRRSYSLLNSLQRVWASESEHESLVSRGLRAVYTRLYLIVLFLLPQQVFRTRMSISSTFPTTFTDNVFNDALEVLDQVPSRFMRTVLEILHYRFLLEP
jgi:hypothetical protein